MRPFQQAVLNYKRGLREATKIPNLTKRLYQMRTLHVDYLGALLRYQPTDFQAVRATTATVDIATDILEQMGQQDLAEYDLD